MSDSSVAALAKLLIEWQQSDELEHIRSRERPIKHDALAEACAAWLLAHGVQVEAPGPREPQEDGRMLAFTKRWAELRAQGAPYAWHTALDEFGLNIAARGPEATPAGPWFLGDHDGEIVVTTLRSSGLRTDISFPWRVTRKEALAVRDALNRLAADRGTR